MWRSLKWILLGACFSNTLLADWDPESLCKDNPSSLQALTNREFHSLKNNVTKALTNSWCSVEKTNLLMNLVLLTQPEICVEIGAFTGSSVLPVAATLKYLNRGKIYAVDSWSNAEAIRYLSADDPNKPWWSQVDMNSVHNSFRELVKTWSLKRFCFEIPLSSQKAIEAIPNGIDFLHLDGDYSEIGTLRDVELYLPKVKPGGYILLSNLYIMIHREQPKIKAFCALCEACELVTSIEQDNAVLFRKNNSM